MAKKNKALAIRREAIEVLPRVAGRDPALERMIEQKIAEMMGSSQDGILQPFFQSKLIENEIRKLQTVPQQRKWHYYFEEWGCLICENRDGRYASLGMCNACYRRTLSRLQAILRRAETERPEQPPARDLQDVARAALRPAQTIAQRREKRAQFAKTLRQALEQGLTLREIAKRYDPGFLNDPEAATERIRIATYRCVPLAVREQRLRERGERNAEVWRQAKALHGKGLTWREIAELLDPEGFAKDPKAAMARMMSGSRRV